MVMQYAEGDIGKLLPHDFPQNKNPAGLQQGFHMNRMIMIRWV